MTISAKILADSIAQNTKQRIVTFEVEYPRFILAEVNTHRMFSRNSASSRAIPVKRQIELVRENTAMPIHWGKNQPGMQANEECSNLIASSDFPNSYRGPVGVGLLDQRTAWCVARDVAIECAMAFDRAGYHKQIVNRLVEPFVHMKTVLTATEFDNFFALRNHKDAQPEFHELARLMKEAMDNSTPMPLGIGDWHLPYYENGYWLKENHQSDLDDALAISASCCAQVSYRRLDDSVEKAKDIRKRLIESEPRHASPFEHQATPIDLMSVTQPKGVTHIDMNENVWSANFRHWAQYRHILEQESKQ